MKKYLLLFAFSSLALISCESEDVKAYDIDTMQGSWKTSKIEIVSGKDDKTVISTDVPSGCNAKSITEFGTDLSTSYTSYFPSGTECASAKISGLFTYDSDTKKMVINYTGESPRTYTVVILNSTELKLKQTYDLIDYNGDHVIDNIYITYKR